MIKEQLITRIIQTMSNTLDKLQLSQLTEVLATTFRDVEMEPTNNALTVDLATNEKLVQTYFVCQKINGMADSTIKAYRFTLMKFMEFANYISWDKVDTNLIRLFLLKCEKQGNKKTTVDNARRNLNTFFQWLENEDYISKNPCRKICRIKEPIRLKRYFSEYEMEALRDSCKNKKELALIDLLISSGLRVGEVPTIKISEIDWNEGQFKVIGKGNKERYGYLTVRAKKHLQEYLKERESRGVLSDYLFCSSRSPYDRPMGKQAINKAIKKIGSRCNMSDIHVHGIRAYFATNLSIHGIPAETIQLLMGHESYSTTVRYYCKPNQLVAKAAVLSAA